METGPEFDGFLEAFLDERLKGHLSHELRKACVLASQKFTEAWETFFLAESRSVEDRREAFATLYGFIRPLVEKRAVAAAEDGQPGSGKVVVLGEIVILGLMCFVPKEQWSEEDLQKLYSELLPVDEGLPSIAWE